MNLFIKLNKEKKFGAADRMMKFNSCLVQVNFASHLMTMGSVLSIAC
ncbi:MAG: hypothetical protein WBM02_08720 [bacterium]